MLLLCNGEALRCKICPLLVAFLSVKSLTAAFQRGPFKSGILTRLRPRDVPGGAAGRPLLQVVVEQVGQEGVLDARHHAAEGALQPAALPLTAAAAGRRRRGGRGRRHGGRAGGGGRRRRGHLHRGTVRRHG